MRRLYRWNKEGDCIDNLYVKTLAPLRYLQEVGMTDSGSHMLDSLDKSWCFATALVQFPVWVVNTIYFIIFLGPENGCHMK